VSAHRMAHTQVRPYNGFLTSMGATWYRGVRMKRRKINPETKMVAVLEGLRGESSIADICRKYQISESLYYRWRDKFWEGGSQALSSRNGSGAEIRIKKAGPWLTLPWFVVKRDGRLTLPHPPPSRQAQETGGQKDHGAGQGHSGARCVDTDGINQQRTGRQVVKPDPLPPGLGEEVQFSPAITNNEI
jgi:transposase